jgi:hypothetical protein
VGAILVARCGLSTDLGAQIEFGAARENGI